MANARHTAKGFVQAPCGRHTLRVTPECSMSDYERKFFFQKNCEQLCCATVVNNHATSVSAFALQNKTRATIVAELP